MTQIVAPGAAWATADFIHALLREHGNPDKVGVYYGDPGGGIVKITRPGAEPEFLLRGTCFYIEDDGTWRIEDTPAAAAT